MREEPAANPQAPDRRLLRSAWGDRRATALAVAILAQALCAFFFVSDAIIDVLEDAPMDHVHVVIELIAAVALAAGMLYLMAELRLLCRRMAAMDAGLRAARGQMADLIETFFDRWGLTAAERDVALLILKGFGNEDIARIRGAAAGTVRAQSARIYAKADVKGRSELFSIFLDELLAGPS